MKGGSISICIFFFFLVAVLVHYFSRKKRFGKGLNLPPGSMGWPYVGETLELYSENPAVFFDTRHRRYGDIFKTHILGCPSVMLASPEAARFVLVSAAHLFKPSYPRSKEILIGHSAIFFHQGNYHSKLRKIVQTSLSLDTIRGLVPAIEKLAVSTLDSWSDGRRLVNTFQEMKTFTFEVAILSIFGQLDSNYRDRLKQNYFILDRGYNCFPINLPGTLFRKALLAKRQLDEILREIIGERRQRKSEQKNNLLNSLLSFRDNDNKSLSGEQIADNIVGVLFAAQDTTASVLTWTLKYMHDDPQLLKSIQIEQKAVYESNGKGQQCLNWNHTRNMPLTRRVIMESLRMASILSFTYREAVADIQYEGFLIPKGWKVMPLLRIIHHNPHFFPKPECFDPSRFEVSQKPNTFLPFGTGAHACPGNEVAKLEMLVLIHHLVNNFRWDVVSESKGVEYAPFPIPKKGLLAKFWKE